MCPRDLGSRTSKSRNKMEYGLVDTSVYSEKFTSYPAELVEFFKENDLKLPRINTLQGQALALLTHPENRGVLGVSRKEATIFFQKIGLETKDSIQPFNKGVPHTGLKTSGKTGYYRVLYPFETDKTDIIKRKDAKISGDRDTQIDCIKNWWRENLVNLPNSEWQQGHLDPTIPDASDNNLAWQPKLQARYRNRFKWDRLFHKMWPTGEELVGKIDEYYTEQEQKLILETLRAKWPQ